MLGFYPYLDIRHNQDDRLVSCTRRPHFTPRKYTGTHLSGLQGCSMGVEGLSHLKISEDPTGKRIQDLPSCGAVPVPTAPPQVQVCILVHLIVLIL
jgi:hypothetical protein